MWLVSLLPAVKPLGRHCPTEHLWADRATFQERRLLLQALPSSGPVHLGYKGKTACTATSCSILWTSPLGLQRWASWCWRSGGITALRKTWSKRLGIWAPTNKKCCIHCQGPKGENIGAITQPLPYSYLIFRAPSEPAGKETPFVFAHFPLLVTMLARKLSWCGTRLALLPGKCWMDALELALRCSSLLMRTMTKELREEEEVSDLREVSDIGEEEQDGESVLLSPLRQQMNESDCEKHFKGIGETCQTNNACEPVWWNNGSVSISCHCISTQVWKTMWKLTEMKKRSKRQSQTTLTRKRRCLMITCSRWRRCTYPIPLRSWDSRAMHVRQKRWQTKIRVWFGH